MLKQRVGILPVTFKLNDQLAERGGRGGKHSITELQILQYSGLHSRILPRLYEHGSKSCLIFSQANTPWVWWVFGLCPSSGILKNTTFQKLGLFPKRCAILYSLE
jgi:hypothetical protein